MNQPLVLITLAFALGIAISSVLNLAWLYGGLALISILVTGYNIYRKSRNASICLLLLAMFMGAFWTGLAHAPESWLTQQTNTYLEVVGKVTEEGRLYTNREVYRLEVYEVWLPEGICCPVKEPLLLQIYATSTPLNFLRYDYGDILRVHGKLELPSGPGNPGEFDYPAYLQRQGINTLMSVRPSAVERLAVRQGNLLRHGVFSLKAKVEAKLQKVLPPEQLSIISALLFGDQAGLSLEEREKYQRTGLIHIFSVSGFHIGFVLLLALFLGRLFRLSSGPNFFLALGMMLFFTAMAGFAVPAVRAVLMASLGLAGRLWQRESDLVNTLALAALVLLIGNPLFLFDVGFQLSVLATWGIVYLYPRLDSQFGDKLPFGRSVILVPLGAQLGILPLVVYHFNLLSLISLLANVLLAGLVGAVILLAFLAFPLVFLFPLGAGMVFLAAGALASLLAFGVNLLNQIPGAAVYIARPSLFVVAVYYIGIIIWGENGLTLLRKWGQKYWLQFSSRLSLRNTSGKVGVCLLLLWLLLAIGWWANNKPPLRITFLDVGQGDCILIQTPAGKRMLIDGGGKPEFSNSTFDVGQQIVVPFLRREGINRLDLVVNTHPDADHVQGLNAVLEAIPVSLVMVAPVPEPPPALQQFYETVSRQKIPVIEAKRGMQIELDPAVCIKVLHPSIWCSGTRSDLNNNSVVLRITHGDNSVLLTGDLEEEGIRDLLQAELALQSHVYKIPHHGSRYSLETQFLTQVNPKLAIICVGPNSFGHPSPEVLEYFYEKAIPLYRTDQHGAIVVESDARQIKILPFKTPIKIPTKSSV
ncbi:MAG: DNA internalization-related competence protein ComEC/Rec2 [Syntrophomonadaceae bacterium]|nr:DNA internalization-related competence protein ComEC/Rec2 [Syntrophomonadaceae bacterium]